ncbi:MAG TPA: gliding motility-associated C-terminal domain-containing protein, partial [Lacibacter sp.]|nr:gliding motility-associated C-terminal domain-containing protein [Lacibacter sp.]HMO90349.1 gliding motility-associated C-terminal domain-containing protein [Lacibacter sp.]HMP86930.1 gliding motility-associated C-terminal domain-containing protein [Lacibacter sp.]
AASGCNPAGSSNASVTITAAVTPSVNFSYNSPVCASAANPSPLTLPGFTAGGVFTAPAGVSINPATGVINLAGSTPGTYTISYNVAASGCNPAAGSTAELVILPSSVPVTGFSYSSPVCINGTNPVPTFVSGFTPGGVFSAPAGVSINPSTGVIDLAGSNSGTYTISYSVPASGCAPAAGGTASIVLASLPPAPGVNNTVDYCRFASTVALTASGSNLRWYTTATGGTGNPVAPTPGSISAGITTYYVSQTVGGCEGPRARIDVRINPLPLAEAGPDKQILLGQSVQLNGAASGNNITILWTPQVNINNPSVATPLVAPTGDITYTINVTSADGCVARDTVRVTILRELVVPNVFSPNGDGVNDRWIIKYIEQYPNNVVQIFNRYGQLLVETRGYSSSNAWDGTHKGKNLPVGAYYYIIRLNSEQAPLRGSISIVR